MSDRLHIGSPPIEINLRRKKNARRLTLRVAADGVYLTIPLRTALKEAEAFANKQEGWIRGKLEKQPEKQLVGQDERVLVEGNYYQIKETKGRAVYLENNHINVPGPASKYPSKIKAFLKERARMRLVSASDHYAGQLGESYGRITLRDTRSRWGSCTSTGNLMYSWRLIMAPVEILNYVAAHEVCHLVEMNHSKRFWDLVENLDANYKVHRSWLREHGTRLHRIDFSG